MRIISGIYKGREIKGYDIEGTRPTTSRVKESLFAMINQYIDNSIVLDLFSGSGNLGIEALSNNAKYCYFVDNNKICCKTIKDNINMLNITNYNILKDNYIEALKYLNKNNIKFNIIFLDPPYKTNYIEDSIKYITEYDLLLDNGILVCENDSLNKIIYPDNYTLLKSKKYSDKWVVILKKI